MEWSHKNSIFLTKLCLYLFVAGYFLVLAFCPALVRIFVTYNYSAANQQPGSFIATIYSCGVPVGLILYYLLGLISRIGREEIFTEENIRCLRIISWMCFLVAIICFVSMTYYVFWGIIACAMALMGLLNRVIKNVFVRAKELKDENDFTI